VSRSGYSDDCNERELNLWRGTVARAIRGKRGQAFLREMRDALDAMPEKRLAEGVLATEGECCAMGAVAVRRGLDTVEIDETDRDEVVTAANWRLAYGKVAAERDAALAKLAAGAEELRAEAELAYAERDAVHRAADEYVDQLRAVEAQVRTLRDALVSVIADCNVMTRGESDEWKSVRRARAALAATEGTK
jgi:hypothetical protein